MRLHGESRVTGSIRYLLNSKQYLLDNIHLLNNTAASSKFFAFYETAPEKEALYREQLPFIR